MGETVSPNSTQNCTKEYTEELCPQGGHGKWGRNQPRRRSRPSATLRSLLCDTRRWQPHVPWARWCHWREAKQRMGQSLGAQQGPGRLRKRKPSPSSALGRRRQGQRGAMSGWKGIRLEGLDAEGEAGLKHWDMVCNFGWEGHEGDPAEGWGGDRSPRAPGLVPQAHQESSAWEPHGRQGAGFPLVLEPRCAPKVVGRKGGSPRAAGRGVLISCRAEGLSCRGQRQGGAWLWPGGGRHGQAWGQLVPVLWGEQWLLCPCGVSDLGTWQLFGSQPCSRFLPHPCQGCSSGGGTRAVSTDSLVKGTTQACATQLCHAQVAQLKDVTKYPK